MQRRRIEHKVESMAEKTRFEIRRVEGCQLIQYIYGYILDIYIQYKQYKERRRGVGGRGEEEVVRG